MNGRSFKGGEQKGNKSYMETNTGSISVAESNHQRDGAEIQKGLLGASESIWNKREQTVT